MSLDNIYAAGDMYNLVTIKNIIDLPAYRIKDRHSLLFCSSLS